MIRFFRAASFAAAAFVFVFGAPSLAWELTEAPVATVLTDPGTDIAPFASPIGAPPPARSSSSCWKKALIRGCSSVFSRPTAATPGRRAEANALKIQGMFRTSSRAEGASTRIHG